jgi:hypothetical protein
MNDQAMSFFYVAQGAGLGELSLGRRGNPTRLVRNQETLAKYDASTTGEETGASSDLTGTESEDHSEASSKSSSGAVLSKATAPAATTHGQSTLGQSIFLAHGRNKKPLEQLEKILRQFSIPFKVAVDEPNLGRPIGVKVREVMHGCNCAILIFTADECLFDKDGNEVWRPSENVGHELGACGYLYQNRIVIIKEDKVDFPTNYRELGYISFTAEAGLESKAMDILKELIGFGIVKVST